MLTDFPAIADISLVYTLVDHWCERHFPIVQYRVLNTPEVMIDEIHDEVLEVDKSWSDAVSLRAFAAPADQMYPLTPFGIDELRDVILQVSVPSLLTAGLMTRDATTLEVTRLMIVGDRFTYSNGIEYDVLVWKIGPTFGNTETPLYYFASCEKVRRDAAPYEGL